MKNKHRLEAVEARVRALPEPAPPPAAPAPPPPAWLVALWAVLDGSKFGSSHALRDALRLGVQDGAGESIKDVMLFLGLSESEAVDLAARLDALPVPEKFDGLDNWELRTDFEAAFDAVLIRKWWLTVRAAVDVERPSGYEKLVACIGRVVGSDADCVATDLATLISFGRVPTYRWHGKNTPVTDLVAAEGAIA